MGQWVKNTKEAIQIAMDRNVRSALSSLEVMNTPDDMHCKEIFR
jgi:hypothetical protein